MHLEDTEVLRMVKMFSNGLAMERNTGELGHQLSIEFSNTFKQ